MSFRPAVAMPYSRANTRPAQLICTDKTHLYFDNVEHLNCIIKLAKTIILVWNEAFCELISSQVLPDGEGRVDVVARLCMVVDWCIDHPEYTAKIKVIPKKDYPVLMPCEF